MSVLLMTSLKFHYYRDILQILISTRYVCLKLSLTLLAIEKIEGYSFIRSVDPSGLNKEAYETIIRNIFLSLEEMISVL